MTVSFAATSITVGEDETSATVCIDISGGLVGDITVLLSSTDASATGTYACVCACMHGEAIDDITVRSAIPIQPVRITWQ